MNKTIYYPDFCNRELEREIRLNREKAEEKIREEKIKRIVENYYRKNIWAKIWTRL